MQIVRIRRKPFYAVFFVCAVLVLLLWNNLKSRTGIRRYASFAPSKNKGEFNSPAGNLKPLMQEKTDKFVAAVLVIACNRPEVERCLDSLLKYRPSQVKFPIVVSQDCGHEQTARVIAGYGDKLKSIKHPDLSEITVPGKNNNLSGYYKLSRHYLWALSQVFDVMQFETVIIVEDDLEIAPDFFEYFEATESILAKDPTLWCVSAWNDNGKEGYISGNDLLYRSDFFPGLGWMLKKSVWAELKPKWPAAFWDDWMRHPDQRRDRACIRPEIPRAITFGRVGVSRGQFFDEHLKYIHLNDQFYPFTEKNLSYLVRDNYDKSFTDTVYRSPLVSFEYFDSGKEMPAPVVRVQYETDQTFVSLANQFRIMTDLKAGVPRMAYRGVVSFVFKGFRIYLAPPRNWNGYEFQG